MKKLTQEMDAIELMEWIAFFKLQDEEEFEKIRVSMNSKEDIEKSANDMRNFLNTLKPKKVLNGPDK